jgi:hypothetical protein
VQPRDLLTSILCSVSPIGHKGAAYLVLALRPRSPGATNPTAVPLLSRETWDVQFTCPLSFLLNFHVFPLHLFPMS